MEISPKVKVWVRDIGEVIATLVVIVVVSKLFLGAGMLIPLVAVTSGSMLHTSDEWQNWLLSNNVSNEEISTFPMRGGFAKGDMVVTITPDGKGTIHNFFSKTELGDVIIYKRDKQHMLGAPPIIHRIVGVVKVKDWEVDSVEGVLDCLSVEEFNGRYIPYVRDCIDGGRCLYQDFPESGDFNMYITKGDNNPRSDQCVNIALPVTDAQLTARGWITIPYLGWLKLILSVFIPI